MYDDEDDFYDDEGPMGTYYPTGCCDLPGCIMADEHYRDACHTAEDAEAYAEAE